MMNFNDFQNAINDYLTNCGQNPEDWDVIGAAWEMSERFPDIDSIDQIDSDEFTAILENEFIEIPKNHD